MSVRLDRAVVVQLRLLQQNAIPGFTFTQEGIDYTENGGVVEAWFSVKASKSDPTPVKELTLTGGNIVVSGEDIILTDQDASNWNIPTGVYYYDIRIQWAAPSADNQEVVFQGNLVIEQPVTDVQTP